MSRNQKEEAKDLLKSITKTGSSLDVLLQTSKHIRNFIANLFGKKHPLVSTFDDALKNYEANPPLSHSDMSRKGGHSKSPNKIKAVRGNLAKANEAKAEKAKA